MPAPENGKPFLRRDNESALYRRASMAMNVIDDSRCVVYLHEESRFIECDTGLAGLATVLTGCQSGKAYVQHVAELVGSYETAGSCVGALVDAGLIRMVGRDGSEHCKKHVADRSITSVGIVTAGRPGKLDYGLRSLVEMCERHERAVKVYVVDGTTDVQTRRHNEAIVAAIKTSGVLVDVRYVVPPQTRLLNGLAVDPDIAWALRSGTAGAGRNLLLLLTAGEHLLFVDDDVVCRTWRLPASDCQAIEFNGHEDRRQVEFFPDSGSALDGVCYDGADLLAAHERVLGHSVRDILNSTWRTDTTRACVHMARAIDGRGFIKASYAGLAGDCAMSSPRPFLVGSGSHRLRQDVAALVLSQHTRQMRHVPLRYQVSHSAWCMSYCFALSNADMSPPFSPVGRNQDGVFGALLRKIDDYAFHAYLPVGILHNVHRHLRYGPGFIQTRVNDVLVEVINGIETAFIGDDPASRLATCGRTLNDLADCTRAEFRARITDVAAAIFRRELMTAEESLSQQPAPPPEAKALLISCREALIAHVLEPDFALPTEFVAPDGGGWHGLQQFVSGFGRLLNVWNDLWAARVTSE